MEMIYIPRLRNKELQTVGENSLRICNALIEVKPAFDMVSATLEVFIKGMQKDKVDSQKRSIYDKKRDKYTSGLLNNIKYEKNFEHAADNAQVVADLLNIVSKYIGINKMPFNEQTAATDNMLVEIKTVLGSNESFPNLTRWIPLIEEANGQFKEVSSDLIKDKVSLKETDAASAIAPQLSEDLQNLYTLMFAYAKIGSNQSIIDAYKELEVLIDSVN